MKISKAINMLNDLSVDYDDDYNTLVNNVMINKAFHRLYYNLYKEIEILLKLGCVVKDVEFGVVDFYSLHEGREIFLCWRMDEKKVKFWHEVDECYADRKPISILLKNKY